MREAVLPRAIRSALMHISRSLLLGLTGAFVVLSSTGCMRAGIDDGFLPVIPDAQMPKPQQPMPVVLKVDAYENGKRTSMGSGMNRGSVVKAVERTGYFKIVKKSPDVLHVAIHDDYDKGMNAQAFFVGLTWGIYSAGGEFHERIDVKLTRGASAAGTGTAAATATTPGAATPAFERSYSGTHYMSMGWFNSPPKKYRGVGIFDASDELAARVMDQFVVHLHQSGHAAARADHRPRGSDTP